MRKDDKDPVPEPGKMNCWEFKKCGREAGGENTGELGVCPASLDESSDGVNGGKCAGRICWAIAGTLCDGELQGSFASKLPSCLSCDFFQHVLREEDPKNFKWLKSDR